jgi:hypothetical protein
MMRGMALTITDALMTSDLTDAEAEFRLHAAADGSGAWVVSSRPARLFDRNQAVSALTIEKEKTRTAPDQAPIKSLESELR